MNYFISLRHVLALVGMLGQIKGTDGSAEWAAVMFW